MQNLPLEIIILAAGQGTRMKSDLPKVLHHVGDQALLVHVVLASMTLNPEKIHIVTGHGSEQVRQSIMEHSGVTDAPISWCLQSERKGTGHAVAQAMPQVDLNANCLILYGDVPLVDHDTLKAMCQSSATLSLLSAKPDNNEGLGRILRDTGGNVVAIVEQKDASEEQLDISEVNTGIIRCKANALSRYLINLSDNNSQGEYYLTDIVAAAVQDGQQVEAKIAADPDRYLGVNSRQDLARVERKLQWLKAAKLMDAGVTLVDPQRIDIRGSAVFGRDCKVDINVVFEGNVTIADNVIIEPNCIIRNASIGSGCCIRANSVIENATVGNHCMIGPFARLRPETALSDHVHIGNFVEIKKSQLGSGSKANHLAYVGDSIVGSDVNIGAGVITCNYDGANKHQTIIGDNVFIGSDSQLVAPVTIFSGATIGAGATITKNVAEDSLAISRSPQKTVVGWNRPQKKRS